jgi:hypothetical protein
MNFVWFLSGESRSNQGVGLLFLKPLDQTFLSRLLWRHFE